MRPFRAGVRDGLEDEAAGRGDRTGGGHTGDGWTSRGLFSAWECGAEAVGLLAVHDLMSEAEVSGTVLGQSISSVVIRCARGGQWRHQTVFTGVEEDQHRDQHDVANGHFKCTADEVMICAKVEGFRGNWNGTRSLRSGAMTGEKDE